MNKIIIRGLSTVALCLAAGSVGAADYYLAARAYTKTMPDLSTVPMWGYVEDVGGACYNAVANPPGQTAEQVRLACVDGLPDPQVPGPRITVDPADTDLNIFLSNALPEPTSLVIAAQSMPVSATSGPTWDDGTTGARANPVQRVRTLGAEAPASGGTQRYSWTTAGNNPLRSGTYILHSGTRPQKQVYMGLYGSVTRDFGVNKEAYQGVVYEDEVVLYYSEIDPVLNESVACEPDPLTCPPGIEPYSTSIYYHPQWFLVNGEPYGAGTPDVFAGSETEDTTLVRFLSTAGRTHVPTLQGGHMTIHAEDGHQYNWQDGLGASTPAPRTQYSVQLPALKTKDAMLHALPVNGSRFAVYDGNGYMTNPSDTGDFGTGDETGGMLVFLSPQLDTDDDGVPDTGDDCPVNANPGQEDGDGDSVGDACDNCTLVANADQRDTDSDGYGNICDADLNQDGMVNLNDFSLFRAAFGQSSPLSPAAENADFNGDGFVNLNDFSIFRASFGGVPGPSGLNP